MLFPSYIIQYSDTLPIPYAYRNFIMAISWRGGVSFFFSAELNSDPELEKEKNQDYVLIEDLKTDDHREECPSGKGYMYTFYVHKDENAPTNTQIIAQSGKRTPDHLIIPKEMVKALVNAYRIEVVHYYRPDDGYHGEIRVTYLDSVNVYTMYF